METVVNELLKYIPSGYDIKQYLSENDPDENMLDEWLFENIYKNKNWLEKEKDQLINFGYSQIQNIDSEIGDLIYKKTPEEI